MHKVFSIIVAAALLSACDAAPADTSRESVPADNTGQNSADRSAQTPTDQSETAEDLQISANIRKAIVADDSLSTNAHNVKIITSGGKVTLRGPVKDLKEKASVESKAKQVAGVTDVVSLIEIE